MADFAAQTLLAAIVLALAGATPGVAVLDVVGSTLRIERHGAAPAGGEPALVDWVRRSASIVQGYYGYFPVKHLALRIATVPGAGVRNGHSNSFPEPIINIAVGRDTPPQSLFDDWVLVHEMVHFALPDVGESHAWLAEGIATYVEGIARVQAGNMTDAELWQEYVSQMPKGLPAPGDGGLDGTASWARTYWGGALFCLLADVRMLELTKGRKGLQEALRAMGSDGGMTVDRDIGAVLAAGDRATATTVLRDLYAEMGRTPMVPDLSALWKRLGIRRDGASSTFDNDAPLADVRRAITAPRSATPEKPVQ